jgi:hypothetical protein
MQACKSSSVNGKKGCRMHGGAFEKRERPKQWQRQKEV